MMFEVITRPEAKKDLYEIFRYISEELFSPQSALKLLDEIESEILGLKTMPKRFPLISDEAFADKGFRLMPVKNYLVFYVVDEQTKTVNILSVMYNRRDWGNLL